MTEAPVSPLRRRMIEDMTIRKFAPRTLPDLTSSRTPPRGRTLLLAKAVLRSSRGAPTAAGYITADPEAIAAKPETLTIRVD